MKVRQMRVVDTALACPACGHPLSIRTSRQLTELLREEYCDCTNDLCPYRFKVHKEIVANLHEGSFDNGLNIPQSLKKQALAPSRPAPDPNQLDLPGIPLDLSCYQQGSAPASGPPA